MTRSGIKLRPALGRRIKELGLAPQTPLVAALVEVAAQQRRGQRRVDEAGGDEVDSDRRRFERQVGDQGGQRGGARRNERQAGSASAAAGAAHEQERAAGPYPADGVLRDGNRQPQMLVEIAVRPLTVEVGQGRVVRGAGRDHHVVDLLGQVASPMPALPPITTTVCPASSARC